MAGRVGPRMDRGLGLASVERPLRAPKAGSYGSSNRRGDGTGGTTYPTVLEAYNRDSDYKRWRAGLDYWQGSGKSWGDLEKLYLIRSFRDFGARPGPQLVSTTYFPSNSSPEGAWTVVCRRRGALILPQLLQQSDISLEVLHPRVDQHRLVLDVSSTLSAAQIREWQAFIGDQFEDSATGTDYPGGLIADPIETIAFTLVDVDADGGRLLFDLSRPFMRRLSNPLRPRSFWQRVSYDRRQPLLWRNDGSRYLCSSHRLYCNCPDFSGGRIADLSGLTTGSQSRFPRPGAGRSLESRWEQGNVGYRANWRDLPPRSDQRRECKHIHAVRWSLEYPFYEPSDYQINSDDRQFQGSSGGSLSGDEVIRYHRLRELTADRLAFALADSSGIAVDTRDTIPSDDTSPAQVGRAPVLWTTQREPEAFRAVRDDWWVQRGTGVLRVFDPVAGRFVLFKTVSGVRRPVIEEVGAKDLIPPDNVGLRGVFASLELLFGPGEAQSPVHAPGSALAIGVSLASGAASGGVIGQGLSSAIGLALTAGSPAAGATSEGHAAALLLQNGAGTATAGAQVPGAAEVVNLIFDPGRVVIDTGETGFSIEPVALGAVQPEGVSLAGFGALATIEQSSSVLFAVDEVSLAMGADGGIALGGQFTSTAGGSASILLEIQPIELM
jgi:hypothetical protein